MLALESSSLERKSLGQLVTTTEIRSSMGPFRLLPEYRTVYPVAIVNALGELYSEYNRAFTPLVALNKEWDSDYQYCMEDGMAINCAVQIDMVGLPDAFLRVAETLQPAEVREILRRRIFEIENSLAMYQLLEKIFSRSGNSFFKPRFRSSLDHLRRQFEKPIALLAVTDQKYQAMKSSEFGRDSSEALSDKEVEELTGFDHFFSPHEFMNHVKEHGGRCNYLLYARTSDPITKLKDPTVKVEHPLLGDPLMRRIVKANSLTLNVDDPTWASHDERAINDTKGYMQNMGMAFPFTTENDLLSEGFLAHLSSAKAYAEYAGNRLNPRFASFLRRYGISNDSVLAGDMTLRCKPAKGTYGCYGHLSGPLSDRKLRGEIRSSLKKRGPYVAQPELTTPKIVNETDGSSFTYIDRVFFAFVGGRPRFLGGFRSMMPTDTMEAAKGRNHGNGSTVWSEITA